MMCNHANSLCFPKELPAGHQRCADGFSTCGAGSFCVPNGVGCLFEGSTQCGDFWCQPGTSCSRYYNRCTEPPPVPQGYHRCEDGVTLCKFGEEECNLRAKGRARCQPIGSRQCVSDLGAMMGCELGKICDYPLGRCLAPLNVPINHHLCADGLGACPDGHECNLEGTGSSHCLLPGSTRCDAGGEIFWCAPGKVCDIPGRLCVNAK